MLRVSRDGQAARVRCSAPINAPLRRSRHRSAMGLVDSFTSSQVYCWALRASRLSLMAALMASRARSAGKRSTMEGVTACCLALIWERNGAKGAAHSTEKKDERNWRQCNARYLFQ